MIYVALTFIYIWFAFWSTQAGRSLPDWMCRWQDRWSWGSEVPEGIIALTLAVIALCCLDNLFNFSAITSVILFAVFALISYAGKQSATWAYLVWEGHKNPDTDRDSTTKPINDWIAARLGYELGDEGYSWVWAFTKGFITTLPIGATGAIFQPLWREIASHAKGRLPFDDNFWMEVGDGFAYASSAILFIVLIF